MGGRVEWVITWSDGWVVAVGVDSKAFSELQSFLVDAFFEELECIGGLELKEFFGWDGVSDGDGDTSSEEKGERAASRPRVVCPFDGNGQDGAFGAFEEEPESGLKRLHGSIPGASALGEDEDGSLLFQFIERGSDGGGVGFPLFERDCAEHGDEPGEEARLEEADACERDDVPFAECDADDGRVQVRLVVGNDEEWAVGPVRCVVRRHGCGR